MVMVESWDAGEVGERLFIIIWLFAFEVKWYGDG